MWDLIWRSQQLRAYLCKKKACSVLASGISTEGACIWCVRVLDRYHTGYATRTYWNIALDNTIFCLGDLILNPFIGRVRKAANTPESVIAFTMAIAGLGDIGKNIFSHLAGWAAVPVVLLLDDQNPPNIPEKWSPGLWFTESTQTNWRTIFWIEKLSDADFLAPGKTLISDGASWHLFGELEAFSQDLHTAQIWQRHLLCRVRFCNWQLWVSSDVVVEVVMGSMWGGTRCWWTWSETSLPRRSTGWERFNWGFLSPKCIDSSGGLSPREPTSVQEQWCCLSEVV